MASNGKLKKQIKSAWFREDLAEVKRLEAKLGESVMYKQPEYIPIAPIQELKHLMVGAYLTENIFNIVQAKHKEIHPNRKKLEYPKSGKVTKPIYTFIQGL